MHIDEASPKGETHGDPSQQGFKGWPLGRACRHHVPQQGALLFFPCLGFAFSSRVLAIQHVSTPPLPLLHASLVTPFSAHCHSYARYKEQLLISTTARGTH